MTRPTWPLVLVLLVLPGCAICGDPAEISLANNGSSREYTVAGSTIEIVEPEGSIWATSSVNIRVSFSGEPERVELYRDGEPFAIVPKSGVYTWFVTGEEERTYEVTAVASAPDGMVESDPVTIMVDYNAPAIVSRSHDSGELNVELSRPMSFVLSEPAVPTSVSTETVALVRPGADLVIIQIPDEPIPVEVTLDPDGVTVHVRPTVALTGPLPLRFDVDGIADEAGNEMSPTTWSWGAAAWASFAPAVEGAHQPDVATDGDTVWLHSHANNGSTTLAAFGDGSWLPATTYELGEAGSTTHDFVLSGDGDNAWAIYRTPSEYQLVHFVASDGTATQERTWPLDHAPGVAVDDAGVAWAAAYDASSGEVGVERNPGTGWEAATTLAVDEPVDVHLAAGDSIYLTATGATDARYYEFNKTSWEEPAGHRMSPAARVTTLEARAERTGTHALLVENTDLGTTLQLRRRAPSDEWMALLPDAEETPEPVLHINSDPAFELIRPRYTVLGSGRAWVAWEEVDTERPAPISRAHVSVWSSGSWYDRAGKFGLGGGEDVETSHPTVATTSSGDPVVAYEQDGQIRVVGPNVYDPAP